LRKLGVISEKLVKKSNEKFNVIDFETQMPVENANIEVYT